MERIEAALKSSSRKDMAFKTTMPVHEEFLAVTTAEDFSVDDFFDLPNDDVFTEEEAEPKTLQDMLHVSAEEPQDNGDALHQSNDGFVPLPPSELAVPTDELAELEWLSHFVEDSFTEYSAPNLTGTPTEKPAWLTGDRKHPLTPTITQDSCLKSPVPSKSRTKRNRNGTNFWSLGSPSSSSSGPSSSNSTSSSSSGPSNTWLSGAELLEPLSTSEKPPVPKKHKKRSAAESVFSGQLLEQQQPSRRCTHCGVQKTPQWRAGPMGAKTLCNACGVRYKSGRLLPEYRPACSPTFSSELHSNHHRKVMEMRRKKEPTDDNETGLNQLVQSPQAVPSF
ncbi:GATA transcription factor 5 [Hirschfeldia incana]|nr:GATA transcription factor 5 [Hirschfeldia incana]